MKIIKQGLLGVFLWCICFAVFALSGPTEKIVDNTRLLTVTKFSKQVEKKLANKGVHVFLIARQGRPTSELPKGVNFTHTGIAVYSKLDLKDGTQVAGYAIYNLYQHIDQKDKSYLATNYPSEFFMGVDHLKAGIIIPTKKLQRRLLEVIGSNRYKTLHNPKYSILSNPYNRKFQNCNEFVLDVLNAAIYQTDNISQLKENTLAHFEAQKIQVNPFKLLLGSLFSSDISVADQGEALMTATFGSIERYLVQNGLVEESFVMKPDT